MTIQLYCDTDHAHSHFYWHILHKAYILQTCGYTTYFHSTSFSSRLQKNFNIFIYPFYHTSSLPFLFFNRRPGDAGRCRVCVKAMKPDEYFKECTECGLKVCDDCASYSSHSDGNEVCIFFFSLFYFHHPNKKLPSFCIASSLSKMLSSIYFLCIKTLNSNIHQVIIIILLYYHTYWEYKKNVHVVTFAFTFFLTWSILT